ncbi:MAG: hypothetical protein CEE38_23725, partial [Planctomycetes bacterium B3_Pla]
MDEEIHEVEDGTEEKRPVEANVIINQDGADRQAPGPPKRADFEVTEDETEEHEQEEVTEKDVAVLHVITDLFGKFQNQLEKDWERLRQKLQDDIRKDMEQLKTQQKAEAAQLKDQQEARMNRIETRMERDRKPTVSLLETPVTTRKGRDPGPLTSTPKMASDETVKTPATNKSGTRWGSFGNESRMPNPRMQTYDGTTPWIEFETYLDEYSQLFDMTDQEKARILCLNLRGAAQSVLVGLTSEKRQSYQHVSTALKQYFCPVEKV